IKRHNRNCHCQHPFFFPHRLSTHSPYSPFRHFRSPHTISLYVVLSGKFVCRSMYTCKNLPLPSIFQTASAIDRVQKSSTSYASANSYHFFHTGREVLEREREREEERENEVGAREEAASDSEREKVFRAADW